MSKRETDLLFPISDTIPGPAVLTGEMVNGDDLEKIPALHFDGSIDEFGYGTAQDVHSTSLAPDDDEFAEEFFADRFFEQELP